jgi:glycerol-3-phosphate dehydrogenase (NAD(P)+)
MGAGAWGTALAKVLADAGNNVALWARRQELADEITDTRRNTGYLGDVELPKSIRATSDPAEALAGACTVLLAVPSQTLRANLEHWTDTIGDDVTLVSLAKGIELDTLMRMSQVVVQVTGADPSRVAVVTGPNLASEIADEQPAAYGRRVQRLRRVADLGAALSTRYLRRIPMPTSSGGGRRCVQASSLACGGRCRAENTAAAIITVAWPRS